jgi:hypothetical protein
MRVLGRAYRADDGTWTVDIELSTETGVRRRTVPRGRDCAEVSEAAAVIVAIAIDPQAAERVESPPEEETVIPEAPAEPEAEPELDPEPEPEPESAPEAEAEALPVPQRPRLRGRMQGMLGVVGGVGYGGLPGVAGTLGGEIGLLLPRVRVVASGSHWFRKRERVGDGTIDFSQWTVGLRAGPVFRVLPLLELMVLAGIEAGQTQIRTSDLAEAQSPNDAWVAWVVQPALAVVPLRWLAVRVGVEAFGPFFRTSYGVRGQGEIFQATPVGVRGVLALEARFP